MSVHITSRAWKVEGISPTQKLVLLKLADNANDAGACWPSIATIAKECCLSERAVRYAIEALESMFHLSVYNRPGTSCSYIVQPIDSGTRCTPAPDAPRHQMPLTLAPDATHPGKSCHSPRQELPPNHKEPSKNRQEPSICQKPQLPFDSAEFAEAFESFRQHRKEIKKPLRPTGEQYVLKQLASMGETEAIQSIRRSIANGWQGIFVETRFGKPKKTRAEDFECDHSKGF